MSHRVVHHRSLYRVRLALPALWVVLLAGSWSLLPAQAQIPAEQPQLVKGANFKQAYKYSNEFLRQFIYSSSVAPNWIGKSDSFWYQYNTSKGKQWYRVNPQAATKEPLFDRV